MLTLIPGFTFGFFVAVVRDHCAPDAVEHRVPDHRGARLAVKLPVVVRVNTKFLDRIELAEQQVMLKLRVLLQRGVRFSFQIPLDFPPLVFEVERYASHPAPRRA